MKRRTLTVGIRGLAWLLGASLWGLPCAGPVQSCTTFILQGKNCLYLARTLDWHWEDSLVVVNPRGLQKASLVLPPSVPAKWAAKYGSVTFNQCGREMPFGGMNEAGLVVENMWLDETQYAAPDARPAINLLQWIQYQLDNCRTVAEVLATDGQLRVESPGIAGKSMARIHYLVCDETGDCATIEFLNGKMICHRGGNLPFRALANDTYETSAAYAQAHPEPRNADGRLKNPTSLARFTRAAARASAFKARSSKKNTTYAFETLDQVCQADFTVWRMVYDLRNRQIHYRTRSHPQERTLDLGKIDFSCSKAAQFVDIQAQPSAQGALNFQELSPAAHRQYLEHFYGQEEFQQKFGNMIPLMEGLLAVIGTYHCAEESSTLANTGPRAVVHVTPAQAQKLLAEKKVIVLDLRTPDEFKEERIAGAKNIDFIADDFERKIARLEKGQDYLVYCASGGRSSQSLAVFKKQQFRTIYHLDGGLNAWQKAGLPMEK